MGGSAVYGCFLGFGAGLPYPLLAVLCVVYSLLIQGDSGSLHTGVVLAADPERRGATMAFQSLLGFAAASISPLVVGMFLDWTGGGKTINSWGWSFIPMAGMVALGPVFIAILTRTPESEKKGLV
jgi:MFS family permease